MFTSAGQSWPVARQVFNTAGQSWPVARQVFTSAGQSWPVAEYKKNVLGNDHDTHFIVYNAHFLTLFRLSTAFCAQKVDNNWVGMNCQCLSIGSLGQSTI